MTIEFTQLNWQDFLSTHYVRLCHSVAHLHATFDRKTEKKENYSHRNLLKELLSLAK